VAKVINIEVRRSGGNGFDVRLPVRISKSRTVALLCAGEKVINYRGRVHLFW
jgi:hypothetical protein